jgi:hypothetical protein
MAVAAEANTIFSQDGAAGGGGGGQALALEKLLTIEALEASPARVLELCALQVSEHLPSVALARVVYAASMH